MRHSKRVFTVFLLATGILVSWWHVRADSPKDERPALAFNSAESVDIRLARAHLALAQIDVRRGIEANKQIPNRVSTQMLERLKLHVEIDQERLTQWLLKAEGDAQQAYLRSAEVGLEIAQADLKRRLVQQASMPNTFSKLQVERAQAAAELATLNLEKARQTDSSQATLAHLQWQIDELRHQVLELQLESFISARGWLNK